MNMILSVSFISNYNLSKFSSVLIMNNPKTAYGRLSYNYNIQADPSLAKININRK